MEGLEIVEISFSFYTETYRNRLDSEYYLMKYLINESKLKGIPISEFIVKDEIINIKSLHIKKDFNYLAISDIRLNSLEYTSNIISHSEIPDRATYVLKNNDIVVSTVRPNRNAVTIIKKPNRLIGTSGFTVIRINDKYINPHFIFIFCKTKFFITKMMRENTATMYPAVTNYDVLNVKIPQVSIAFQNKISELVDHSYSLIERSKSLYTQAETLLLETLGLKNFEITNSPFRKEEMGALRKEGVNIRRLSESFGGSGRLDAEYYQAKYDEIIDKVTGSPYNSLVNLVDIKKSIEPGSTNYSSEGLPFVRVSDYTKVGLMKPDKYLSESFVRENKTLLQDLKPKKETILFSKDGSVGVAYMLRGDANFVTSSAILHLTVKDKKHVIPEYLTLALNSKVVQMQAERDVSGSIILHWRVSEIKNVIVPIIDYDKQIKIAELVEQSFALKKQSEHLLEMAKTAVEMAIEQGEEAALAYIKQKINTSPNS